VKSERAEARDGRGERPEGQPLIAPERPTTWSLEGGAVVKSERIEDRDGRDERPEGQPLIAPERPTTWSLEGGAVVKSERIEARDGRDERPEGQPLIAPERPASFASWDARQVGSGHILPANALAPGVHPMPRRPPPHTTVLLAASIGLSLLSGSSPADESQLFFEEHIRPILKAHCLGCHGATEELEGGLDLRLVRLMTAGGESGPAIASGDPDGSLLLQRIRSGEMPPGDAKVSPEELDTLSRWVASGAATKRPEPEDVGPGLGITPEERAFWAFQPIARADLPADNAAVSPIDLLLTEAASPDRGSPALADRRTLVIRAHLTLTGLPPSYQEVLRWEADPRPDWFAQLTEELLASPHYGERWARHWLDVAGYADSEGATTADAVRPWAWKYRDYVIQAFNDDIPFDRFIAEQLAGDELAGPKQGDYSAEQIRLLTATGFLRMAADGTGSGGDTPEGRNQTVADTVRIVGTSFLGLSVHCAQCHDHRYDPFLQSDYTALRAVFEPALDWQDWKPPAARLVSLQTESERAKAAEIEAEAQMVVAERAGKEQAFIAQAVEMELAKFEEPLREQLKAALDTPADQRSDEQKTLLDANPSVQVSPGVLYQYLPQAAEELKGFDARVAEIRATKPAETFVRAVVEPAGHVPETRLFHRGDHAQPKQVVQPAPPLVAMPADAPLTFAADDTSLPTTGRRLALARWLASDGNPLTARVLVNRIWMHHFGTGLVSTPADFGTLGSRPSHPELLDWLAVEFREHDWSLKHLHRVIMQSAAWQQARTGESTDGLSSQLVRLEAEAIRDRMLAVTGQLDASLYGPPLPVKEDETGQTVVDGSQTRRSLYVQQRRSQPVAMLAAFDAPVMETNCEARSVSTVATQSLILLNGSFTLEAAAALAERAETLSTAINTRAVPGIDAWAASSGSGSLGDVSPAAVVAAWRLAFARDPSPAELAETARFIESQLATLRSDATKVPEGRSPQQQVLVNLCQVLLGSNEFLSIE
jgi:mono/diheme cytochrome c family protein